MSDLITAVLPRTLLIHRQYGELAKAFTSARIPFMLLKGVAFIECFPDLMRSRNMEDMDIMVPPAKYESARKVLANLGYWPAPQDPAAHIHISQPVAVDFCDNLWYLDQAENEALWSSGSTPLGDGSRVLNPVDFYVHIFAHGAIHHANASSRWKQDLAVLNDRWHVAGLPALTERLRMLGWEELHDFLLKGRTPHKFHTRIMLRLSAPKAGHIARVLMLRRKMLGKFLLEIFFPDSHFIRGRYDAQTDAQVLLWKAMRPFLLLKDVLITAYRHVFPGAVKASAEHIPTAPEKNDRP